MSPIDPPPPAARPAQPGWRWLPLALLATGAAVFLAFGLDEYLSFATLARHRGDILAWVGGHPVLAPLVYIAGYVLAIAFALPGGVALTVTGGFLFGPLAGALFAILGATGGATVVFLAARTAFGERLRSRAGTTLQRLQDGFRRDAFSYLLVLRLVPLFPFFIVNLVPALAGVSLRTYTLATVIGVIPGTFVFANLGNGLGAVLDAGATPDLRIMLKPQILLPIFGLAVLALVPVGYRRWKGPQ